MILNYCKYAGVPLKSECTLGRPTHLPPPHCKGQRQRKYFCTKVYLVISKCLPHWVVKKKGHKQRRRQKNFQGGLQKKDQKIAKKTEN